MMLASLRDVSVILDDRPVLRSLSLDVGPGLTVLRGANGAGKTTLLRTIQGLLPINGGTRTVSGAPLFVGHRAQLLRGLSARENLRFLVAFRSGRDGTVDQALAAWGLDSTLAARPVETLSAGQRHRAALARIDVERSGLVLLDEPFADLDDAGVSLVRDAIARVVAAGTAVVVATHGHHDLDTPAAAVWVLDRGRLG